MSPQDMTLIFATLVLAITVGAREWLWRRHLAAEKREADRRLADTRAEMQKEIDRSATAVFVRLRERLVLRYADQHGAAHTAYNLSPLFDVLAEQEPAGVQANLDWWRERCNMLIAAQEHAQRKVAEASSYVNNVNAENGLCRNLLEQVLRMPADTRPEQKALYYARIQGLLDTPRPNHEPGDDVWQRYVKAHVAQNGDAAAILAPQEGSTT